MLVAIKIFLFHVVSSLNFVCSNVIQAAFFAYANVDFLIFLILSVATKIFA